MSDLLVTGYFVILALLFVGHLACTVLVATALRRLADAVFEQDPDLWVSLGRPRGTEVTHKRLSFWTSDLFATRLLLQCVRSTPEWALHVRGALDAIHRLRWAYRAMYLNMFVLMAFLVASGFAFARWSGL